MPSTTWGGKRENAGRKPKGERPTTSAERVRALRARRRELEQRISRYLASHNFGWNIPQHLDPQKRIVIEVPAAFAREIGWREWRDIVTECRLLHSREHHVTSVVFVANPEKTTRVVHRELFGGKYGPGHYVNAKERLLNPHRKESIVVSTDRPRKRRTT